MQQIDKEILETLFKFLSSVVTLIFTIAVFWNMYHDALDKALIFSILLVAAEIQKLNDRFME